MIATEKTRYFKNCSHGTLTVCYQVGGQRCDSWYCSLPDALYPAFSAFLFPGPSAAETHLTPAVAAPEKQKSTVFLKKDMVNENVSFLAR